MENLLRRRLDQSVGTSKLFFCLVLDFFKSLFKTGDRSKEQLNRKIKIPSYEDITYLKRVVFTYWSVMVDNFINKNVRLSLFKIYNETQTNLRFFFFRRRPLSILPSDN